jgi:prophage maintenance system killer protein
MFHPLLTSARERLPEKDAASRKTGYLLCNVIILHLLLDGNKRTAFELAMNFLSLNG